MNYDFNLESITMSKDIVDEQIYNDFIENFLINYQFKFKPEISEFDLITWEEKKYTFHPDLKTQIFLDYIKIFLMDEMVGGTSNYPIEYLVHMNMINKHKQKFVDIGFLTSSEINQYIEVCKTNFINVCFFSGIPDLKVNNDTLKSIIKNIEFAQDANEIDVNIESLNKVIRANINFCKNINIGQIIFIPFNTNNHATMIIVHKESNDIYNVYNFNSGAGGDLFGESKIEL